MFGINKYILIIISVLILVMSATISFQYKAIESKNKDIATLELSKSLIESKLKVIEAQRTEDQKIILSLSIQNKENEIVSNNMKKELEKAKANKKVILAKPKLIQSMANKKTAEVFNEIECLTGNKEACK